jgi:subtilase family protein/Big-like domain-containing protein/VCBS repeat protein
MTRSRLTILWILLICCCVSIPAYALDIVFQDPTLDTYVVQVNEPLTLIFDETLNVGTVNTTNVKIRRVSDSYEPGIVLSVQTSDVANDTIVIDPSQILDFGTPYEFVIDSGLASAGGSTFSGSYPFGAAFVCNIPNDLNLPDYDSIDSITSLVNPYLGFDPTDPENTDESKFWRIPGMAVTEAWKYTTGRPDVLIAVVDDGLVSYEDPNVADNFFLNVGELPLPNTSGTPCGDYDCNGDGKVSISDYALDTRLLAHTGGTLPHAGTAIAVFSDGVDDDGNGLVDDISGWDFFRNVNEAIGVDEFPEGTHGGGQANQVAGIANDGNDRPGMCPNCMVLPIRVSEAVLADYNRIGAGLNYAASMGADLAAVAMGTLNYNEEAHQAVLDAYEGEMLVIAASGDELGFHHLYPAAGEDVVSIKAIFPFPPLELLSIFSLDVIAFTESYCTNHGAHVHLTVPAGHICTSEAVGSSTGIAGLILSRARDLGIDLTANELKQLMTMTVNDIKNRCVNLTGGGCQPGFDEHFGYGRLNAKYAIERLGDPDAGIDPTIPPVVRMTSPRWWEPIDPLKNPTMTISGQVGARGEPFHYQIEYARGVEPLDGDFQVLAENDSTAELDGTLFTVDVGSLIPAGQLRQPSTSANDKTVTFRLRAYWENGSERIWGEARKAISMFVDDASATGLLNGFPIELGASGESSVALYDLNGDANGRMEIIFATSDGFVHVYGYDEQTDAWDEIDGFPVDIGGDDPDFADTVIGATAVGDIYGNGSAQIVAVTYGGAVYAIQAEGNAHPNGPFLPGFPVFADEPPNATTLEYGHGNAFVASPVLADLDLDGKLEIIAGNFDQKAYAWKVDDGTGSAGMMPGWPVIVSSDPALDQVPWRKRCHDNPLPGQVLGSPAVLVLDPENTNPDIRDHPAVIVPCTETCENSLLPTSRVYAIYWNGTENDNGPFLPGWPATPMAPLGDAIPIPPLTVGMTNSPAVAFWGGQAKIAIGGFFWLPEILTYDGTDLTSRILPTSVNLTLSSNGTFAPIMGDDSIQFILPTIGLLNRIDGKIYPESFNIMAWDFKNDAEILFRKKMEDILFFYNPVVADLNDDGLPEILAGSGGYLLHGFNVNGDEPAGFPKTTGGWIISSPAVGDIDRDGRLEIVLVTHEGYLWAWETEGSECKDGKSNSAWPKFRHDEHNSGFLGHDATPPRMIHDLNVQSSVEGQYTLRFSAPGDDGGCGIVESYDVRYSQDPNADLSDPEVFAAAPEASIGLHEPLPGNYPEKIGVVVPGGAEVFAVRAIDDRGYMSQISNVAEVNPEDGDDDDGGRPEVDDMEFPGVVPNPVIEKGEDIGCGC